MPVYLDEGQFAWDARTIGFPHVLLCMGVVVVTRTRLYGIHLGIPEETDDLVAALHAYIQRQHSRVRMLYGSCNLEVRYAGTGNRQPQWRAEMTAIAGILNYTGHVYGFNTGIIAPRHGTYVQYDRPFAMDQCDISYKRHEKMVHDGGDLVGGNPVYWVQKQFNGNFTTQQMTGGTLTATVYPDSNTGVLHVAKVQQLMHFVV